MLNYNDYCNTFKNELEICKHGSLAPIQILLNLGENQGGSGRHKCTNCAFKKGFEEYNVHISLLVTKPNSIISEVAIPKLSKVGTAKKQAVSKVKSKEIDYLQREIINRSLGFSGELAVMFYEANKLKKLGIKKAVKHISKELGNLQGYDVLSYDENGKEIFIEVKTTRLPNSHAFFITRNELEFSKNNNDKYFLYRIFDFNPKTLEGKFYILKGDVESNSILTPVIYEALPNS
jgi:hypothetical protein